MQAAAARVVVVWMVAARENGSGEGSGGREAVATAQIRATFA